MMELYEEFEFEENLAVDLPEEIESETPVQLETRIS